MDPVRNRLCGFLILFGIIGEIYRQSIKEGLTSIQTSVTDLRDITIRDLKTDLGKRMDGLENRIARFEYPAFRQKATSAGLNPSFNDFKSLLNKAAASGLSNPTFVPINFSQPAEKHQPVVYDAQEAGGYNLEFKVTEITKDKIQFLVNGTVGGVTLKNGRITLPMKIGSQLI